MRLTDVPYAHFSPRRFIKDHFADAFRLLPDASPPQYGSREEKWINSATLAQASENISPAGPPKTPEPQGPYLPSFALSTPSGTSPQSIKGSSSPGSPLHALQFIRRAEMDSLSYRPETPALDKERDIVRAQYTLSSSPTGLATMNLFCVCCLLRSIHCYTAVHHHDIASYSMRMDQLRCG